MATQKAKKLKKGKKESPKVDFLKSFVKKVDGEQVLILPESKAKLFVKLFLRRVQACNDSYADKFMRMAFGLQEFNVDLEAMVLNKVSVMVQAKSKEEAVLLATAKTSLPKSDHFFNVKPDSKRNVELKDAKAVGASCVRY